MRDSLGYSAFASKQEALLSHSPLAGLTLPHQFPFNPLTFHPPNFLAPPTSTQSPATAPSPILPQHHALLSAFSQNMKQAPKLWWAAAGGGPTQVPHIYKETESEASAKVKETNVSYQSRYRFHWKLVHLTCNVLSESSRETFCSWSLQSTHWVVVVLPVLYFMCGRRTELNMRIEIKYLTVFGVETS